MFDKHLVSCRTCSFAGLRWMARTTCWICQHSTRNNVRPVLRVFIVVVTSVGRPPTGCYEGSCNGSVFCLSDEG